MVIRPLIDVSRADLRMFAAEHRLAFREDESNADLAVPRNRIRHELLPYLAREFSPGIVEVLAREAELAREDDDRLESEAIEIARSVVLTHTLQSIDRPAGPSAGRQGSSADPAAAAAAVEVDIAGLNAQHAAIASRVARIALGQLRGAGFIGFDQIQRFLEFARSGKPGSALSLPGQQAVHMGERIRLQPEPPRAGNASDGLKTGTATSGEAQTRGAGRGVPATASAAGLAKPTEARTAKEGPAPPRPRSREGGNSFQIPLSIPGEVILPARRWAVSADWASAAESDGAGGLEALVKGVNGPLTVRSRRPGDRFQPPGLGGRAKKLQDYFVDRKVPRAERDQVPLVVDRDDRIVWIVGHAVADGVRATNPAPGVILLKARQLGGEV